MSQNEIIRCLEKLIPEITANKDPEGVMLKYAKENRMPCAVLEKLAQTYNIAKTLNFMDKSADRTGSFAIMDPADLLKKYSAYAPPKASAKSSELSEWFDLREKCASTRLPSASELESFDKAASVESQITLIHDAASALMRKRASLSTDIETLEQIEYDHRQTATEGLRKIAGAIAEMRFEFSELDEDLQNLSGSSIASDRISRGLTAMGCKHERLTKYAKHLGRDRTGFASVAFEILENLDISAGAVKAAAVGIDELNQQANAYDIFNRQGKGGGKEKKKPEAPKSFPDQIFSDVGAPNEKKDKPKGDNGKLAIDAIQKILSRDTLGGVYKPYQVGKSMIDEVAPSPNRKTRLLRESEDMLDDDAGMMHLQRFMASDPVISKSDPSEVIALYNSIKSSDPKLVRDPSGLKFALRETLQYGSMPLHTTKELLTVADLRNKSKEKQLANTDTLANKF